MMMMMIMIMMMLMMMMMIMVNCSNTGPRCSILSSCHAPLHLLSLLLTAPLPLLLGAGLIIARSSILLVGLHNSTTSGRPQAILYHPKMSYIYKIK